MTQARSPQGSPVRDAHHDALEVFVGEWSAKGQSFGSPGQDAADPRNRSTPWTSKHLAHWHTGKFFLIQEERAQVDGPFDTLSILGWDAEAARYFARSFENHGHYRHYRVTVSGRVWTFNGATERARIEFSADGKQQKIGWEWKPHGKWLPLCDRVAVKSAT
jgi:hypothetical protein